MSLPQIILALLLAVVGPLIYGVFFRNLEERIRSWLADARAGWTRRRYVRVFVHAIRGEAAADETRTLGYLVLAYPLALILWSSNTAGEFDSTLHQMKSNNQSIKEMINREGRLPDVPSSAEDMLEVMRKDMLEVTRKVTELTTGTDEVIHQLHWVLYEIWGVTFVGIVWIWWLSFVRQPFAVFTRRFAHELERFSLRIQGLASKAELAELVNLESQVRDEETAARYVAKMASIAKRHGVEHLVDTFLLWGAAPPTNGTVD